MAVIELRAPEGGFRPMEGGPCQWVSGPHRAVSLAYAAPPYGGLTPALKAAGDAVPPSPAPLHGPETRRRV